MTQWRGVSLPADLIEEVEHIIRRGKYTSIAEFVSEAIRLRIEQVKKPQQVVASS